MIRIIIGLLFFILCGVGLTLFFREDNGYVLLRYQDTVVETSLVFFTVSAIVALWLLGFIWAAARTLLNLPTVIPAAFRQRKLNQSRDALLRGLRLYLEGQWREAESSLTNKLNDPNARLIHYLFAARAAQYQQQIERRDQHIEQAHKTRPGSETAVLLTQARLQLMHNQDTQALASLEHLYETQRDHPVVVKLLLQALQRLKDWERLADILPEADRLEAGPANWRRDLGIQVYQARLHQAGQRGYEQLSDCWESLPRKLRRSPKILEAYIGELSRFDQGKTEAARLISQNLKRGWYPALALMYGELPAEKDTSQLAAVEEWIKQHGEQKELLYLAGRLCLRNQLWGRARSYFEQLLKVAPTAQVWQAMGQLHLQTGDNDKARQAFENGLQLAMDKPGGG